MAKKTAPKTPKVEAKNTAKSTKAVAQVKKVAAAKAKKTVVKVQKVKDEATKIKAATKAKAKKESSAKAKKAIEKIKANKLSAANYKKGVEEIQAKKLEAAKKDTPAIKKVKAKGRKAAAARVLKKTVLKSKAVSDTHQEHEKQPQPRWK